MTITDNILNSTSSQWRQWRQEAIYFALEQHGPQEYDGLPYIVHLMEVEQVLRDHSLHVESYEIENVPTFVLHVTLAAWLHDILEDTNTSFRKIKDRFGIHVANIVYNVTNELGKYRSEIVKKTYPKIQQCEMSTCVKLADRIANVRYGLSRALNSKVERYVTEYETFRTQLFNETHQYALSLWNELDALIARAGQGKSKD